MASLPLFPLGTVLLPGAQLPLQIFEPRYVTMLKDLLELQDERPPVFGVVAIREGFEVGEDGVRALHPVGCAARLTGAAVLEDGRYLIVSEGTRRFRVDGVDGAAGTPYLTADVTWLDDLDGDPDAVPDLARRLRDEIERYRVAVADDPAQPDDPAEPPEDDRDLSFWVPAVLELELAERQQLLATGDTASRLRLGLQLVRRERMLGQALGTVSRPPDRPMNLN